MKFQFKIQGYQTEAVEDTINVFRGQPKIEPNYTITEINPRGRSPVMFPNGSTLYCGEVMGDTNEEVDIKRGLKHRSRG